MGMSSSNQQRGQAVLSEINVTPLVDVMLVLLVIFMVTTPLMTQGLDVDLPETASSGIPTKEKPLILKIKKNQTIYIGSTSIPISQIKDKLKAIMASQSQKQVYIEADKAVPYGVFAQTMGEVRAAGVFNIGLITLPKSK